MNKTWLNTIVCTYTYVHMIYVICIIYSYMIYVSCMICEFIQHCFVWRYHRIWTSIFVMCAPKIPWYCLVSTTWWFIPLSGLVHPSYLRGRLAPTKIWKSPGSGPTTTMTVASSPSSRNQKNVGYHRWLTIIKAIEAPWKRPAPKYPGQSWWRNPVTLEA